MDVEVTADITQYNTVAERIILTLRNISTADIHTGLHYQIEKYGDGAWSVIPLDFMVDDILFTIRPDESRSFDIDLLPEQYEYTAGRYRVVKNITVDNQDYDITYEFNME